MHSRIDQIKSELKQITAELNDRNMIMDEEWRKHLRDRRNALMEEQKVIKKNS